jgi:prepilin-type processing-associated H-X9-DG protein
MRIATLPIQSDTQGEVPPDTSGACDEMGDMVFGSAHPGGINVLFGDGSVDSLGYDIEPELMNRMANRHDGEVGGLGR